MKTLILSAFALCTVHTNAQNLDFAISVGTGKIYVVESLDKTVNVNYSLPMSLLAEIKYRPLHKNWGLKLRLQQIQSDITGENWVDKSPLNGYINSFSISLLLENEITRKKYSYGFNFGMGITKETIQAQKHDPNTLTDSGFPTVTAGGHLAFKLSNDLDFQIQPVLLCHDPFKSIKFLLGSRDGNLAGEDISGLINFGIRYHFLK